MKEKLLLDSRGRGVIIKITSEHILFYHQDVIKSQEDWFNTQVEMGVDINENEKNVDEFYSIDRQQWIDDFTQRQDRDDNFHKHMNNKNWFTEEMYLFINDSCKLGIK